MPFVQRIVNPVFISRSTSRPNNIKNRQDEEHNSSSSSRAINDYELETVTNLTLSNALKQLASLVLIADDIFTELNKELKCVSERCLVIKERINILEKKVDEHDPKLVTVRKFFFIFFINNFICNSILNFK